MATDSIRVLLVDDHQVLRDGLQALLDSEDDIAVIGGAGTAEEGVRLTLDRRPDVVVMDLGLPDDSGLDAIQQIRDAGVDCRIVVLSMHTGREFVVQAVEAGADGYVPKSSAHTSLLTAIRIVQQGERYLHPKAATARVESITEPPTEAQRLARLSDREREVLRLTAMGFTSREIGQQLSLSHKTVGNISPARQRQTRPAPPPRPRPLRPPRRHPRRHSLLSTTLGNPLRLLGPASRRACGR